MKIYLIPALIFCITIVRMPAIAQGENKVVISQSMQGNIFRPAKVEATTQRINSLKLPPGFKISKFAEGLKHPRMMAVGSDGTVYVTNREEGTVTMLQDKDNDGKAEINQVVINKDKIHGLYVHDDKIYFITVNEVYTSAIKNDGTLDSLIEIMNGLPDGGQHGNRTLAFGPNNMLYISVGSTCNACKETSEESATLIQANPDGNNRRIFAKGLRNTIGFDWHPQTKQLYGFDHGIDWLGDDATPEELNKIEEGKDYGWPFVFAKGKFELHHDPKGMTHAEYAAKTTYPEMLYTSHAAPLDFKFYKGSQFPMNYSGDAFATMHGSWNRKIPSGYKVVRVRYENGKPVKFEDFVTGFLSTDNKTHFGRVCGLAETKDGSLLISDDANGVIYRVTYTGRK